MKEQVQKGFGASLRCRMGREGGDASETSYRRFSEVKDKSKKGQNEEDRPWRNRLEAGLTQRSTEGETGQRKPEQMNGTAQKRANKEVGKRGNGKEKNTGAELGTAGLEAAERLSSGERSEK